MFKESFPTAAMEREPAVSERLDKIVDTEGSYESVLARLRKHTGLNSIIRGALGLTSALAIGSYAHEAHAKPTVHLSFTEIDPNAEVKQKNFAAEASAARHRAFARELTTLHDNDLRLLFHSDTSGDTTQFNGDLASLLQGKTVVYNELATTFKSYDSRDEREGSVKSGARLQQHVYARAQHEAVGTQEASAVQHVEGRTRNDAVQNALGLLALRAQELFQLNIFSESLIVKHPIGMTGRRATVIAEQAYHVSHTQTAVALSDVHITVREVVKNGKKIYEAAASARGTPFNLKSPREIAQN